MDRSSLLWLSGFIAGTSYLSVTYRSSYAFDRPLQSAIAILVVAGVAVIVSSRVSYFTPPRARSLSIPPSQKYLPHASRAPSPNPAFIGVDGSTYSLPRLRAAFILLVAAICARSELARRVITQIQCAGTGVTSFIPMLLVIHEYWNAPAQALSLPQSRSRKWDYLSITQNIIYGRPGDLLLIILLSCSSMLAFMTVAELPSTYICADVYAFRTVIPVLQIAGTFLDTFIIISADHLVFRGHETTSVPSSKSVASLGWALLISPVSLVLAGMVVFWRRPGLRYWIKSAPIWYVSDTVTLALAVAFTVVCALQMVSHIGTRSLAVIALFTSVFTRTLTVGWSDASTFPPRSVLGVLAATALLLISMASYIWVETASNPQSVSRPARTFTRLPKRFLTCFFVLFVLQTCVWLFRSRADVSYHPVQHLILDAEDQHQLYLKQASSSRSVDEAAKTYRLRYGRDPPPRFGRWYSYAILQESTVIDDFDSISNDLLPFWSLTPAEIRLRTWETLSNPGNSIGGIIIRNGKAEVSSNVPGSHRWMLDGVIHIMTPFLKWLPDMDLAFNLNDECRVAVPFRRIEGMRRKGLPPSNLRPSNETDYKSSRAVDWQPIAESPIEETRFIERSFSHVFHDYGSVGCPPSSKARRERHWDVGSHCSTCTSPHSLQQFVRNWTLAADPCHQPDFADLHGIYLSPAAFKTSNELMPVFSQSKAHGFNDILYPSAWNYEDKAVYAPTNELPDPSFVDKESMLFWRGATSEGVSFGTGTWRGMTRQRLVHLFNNASSSSHHLLLLPATFTKDPDPRPATYAYRAFAPAALHANLNTSLGIVDRIERCRDRDCQDQDFEFAPQYFAGTDFQEHWRYKYLFDVDGAGFSGRFLPFLQSGSLPFKTGLMREWWESRVTAWKHFVPVDVRLMEVWSLLAYFAGWKEGGMGTGTGDDAEETRWLMPPHEAEAEAIAVAGREWAGKALRKEDMEVYFFRLLLEWARLTDDSRDNLGWTADLKMIEDVSSTNILRT